jgi:hypothetical protein
MLATDPGPRSGKPNCWPGYASALVLVEVATRPRYPFGRVKRAAGGPTAIMGGLELG